MNKGLINSGLTTNGIYRAMLNYDGNIAKIYIPCLSDSNTNENNGYTLEGLFSSLEMKNTAIIGKSPCWVTFENGDSRRPIIMGYFGKGIRSIGGQGFITSNNSSSQTPNNGNTPPPVSNDTIKLLLQYAESKLGCAYAYGQPNPRSTNPNINKFDCSGYIYWCYGQVGINVGTSTAELVNNGVEVSIDDLQPGDLIIWAYHGNHGRSAHVVMVYDNNTIIHCGSPGTGAASCVNKRNISYAKGYYNNKDYKSWARRIIQVTNESNDSNTDIKTQLDNIINKIQGNFTASYYFKNLQTGEVIDSNSSKSLYAASLIKLFVMAKVYDCINKGQLIETDVSNDLKNMITISDNEATNRLTELIGDGDFNAGASAVTDYAKSLGCTSTIFRNELGTTNVAINNRNVTSTADCANILDKIYNKNLVSSDSSNKMLKLLKAQTRKNKIPAGVPNSATVANKTGETTYADNDAAIVFTNNDRGDNYIFTVMIQDFNNPSGELWVCEDKIKDMSSKIYDYVTN